MYMMFNFSFKLTYAQCLRKKKITLQIYIINIVKAFVLLEDSVNDYGKKKQKQS